MAARMVAVGVEGAVTALPRRTPNVDGALGGGGAGTGEAATAAARTKNKCTPKVRKEFPG